VFIIFLVIIFLLGYSYSTITSSVWVGVLVFSIDGLEIVLGGGFVSWVCLVDFNADANDDVNEDDI
jgi:hypothetical protein